MDEHLKDSNPALRLYGIWRGLVDFHNDDYDKIADTRAAAGLEWNELGYFHGGTRFRAVPISRHVELRPTGNDSIGMSWVQRGGQTASIPLIDLWSDGSFEFNAYLYRLAWKELARHTFIAHSSRRGDLIAVQLPRHGSGNGWDFSTYDVDTRLPYVRIPRYDNGSIFLHKTRYSLVQDERGHWRYRADLAHAQELLDEAYAKSDKLYAYRRRRKYNLAGIIDPESPPRIIIQNPEALAKAFVVYSPAEVAFPSRKPVEATHG